MVIICVIIFTLLAIVVSGFMLFSPSSNNRSSILASRPMVIYMEWFMLNRQLNFLIGVIIILIAAAVLWHVINKKHSEGIWLFFAMSFISVFVFCIVFPVVTFFAHQSQYRSRVDVSPLEHLTGDVLSFASQVADQINSGTNFNADAHTFRYRVAIYDNEAQAVRAMYRRRPSTVSRRGTPQRYQEIVHDNGTQAILLHCVNNLFFPRLPHYRWFRSFVRVENIVIEFSEVRPLLDRDNNDTSRFIMMFIELLEEIKC